MSWQPIESAPKDGTAVVLYTPPGEYTVNFRTKEKKLSEPKVGEGLMLSDEWHWANDSCSCCYGPIYPVQPTHWMPLPEPPK